MPGPGTLSGVVNPVRGTIEGVFEPLIPLNDGLSWIIKAGLADAILLIHYKINMDNYITMNINYVQH